MIAVKEYLEATERYLRPKQKQTNVKEYLFT